MAAVSWPEMTSLSPVSSTYIYYLLRLCMPRLPLCTLYPCHAPSPSACSCATSSNELCEFARKPRDLRCSVLLCPLLPLLPPFFLLRFDFLWFSLRCCFLAASFFGIISFPLPGTVEIRVRAGRQHQRGKTSRRTSFCLHKISQVETSAQRSRPGMGWDG